MKKTTKIIGIIIAVLVLGFLIFIQMIRGIELPGADNGKAELEMRNIINQGDYGECANITGNYVPPYESMCYEYFIDRSTDPEMCEFPGIKNDYNYSLFCHKKMALKLNDEKICEKARIEDTTLSPWNECWKAMAVKNKKEFLCEKILPEIKADNVETMSYVVGTCYGEVAAEKKDSSICSEAKTDLIRNECLNYLKPDSEKVDFSQSSCATEDDFIDSHIDKNKKYFVADINSLNTTSISLTYLRHLSDKEAFDDAVKSGRCSVTDELYGCFPNGVQVYEPDKNVQPNPKTYSFSKDIKIVSFTDSVEKPLCGGAWKLLDVDNFIKLLSYLKTERKELTFDYHIRLNEKGEVDLIQEVFVP